MSLQAASSSAAPGVIRPATGEPGTRISVASAEVIATPGVAGDRLVLPAIDGRVWIVPAR